MVLLSARGLSKTYPAPRDRFGRRTGPAVRALSDFDLDLAPGETWALVGPNGSGKTTALRILAGVLLPDAGTAEVEGRPIGPDRPAARARVGWMPDFFGNYPTLSVFEYLDFFGEAYGIPPGARARRIAEKLDVVGLSEKRDAPCAGLSRGMNQRLCLARALLPDPPVLLLDEPASGLDPLARSDLFRRIEELRAGGKALVVSSHILAELESVATHAVVLERGRTTYRGPLEGAALPGEAAGAAFEVRLARPIENAPAQIAAFPGVASVEGEGEASFVVHLEPGAAPDAVLSALVGAGLPVVHFARAARLEAILRKTTKGEVQ